MSEFYWAFDESGTPHLEHHGVKGQKWGVITKEYEPVGPKPKKVQPQPLKKRKNIKTQEDEPKRITKFGTALRGIGAAFLGLGAIRGFAGNALLKRFGVSRGNRLLNIGISAAKAAGAYSLGRSFMVRCGIHSQYEEEERKKRLKG